MIDTKLIMKAVNDGVIEKIESVRCPKHGKRAKVTNVKKTPKGYDFKIEGCCEDLVQKAASFK